MLTFKTKKHIEVDEDFQGINLTEFTFVVDEKLDSDQIVDTFLRSDQYSFESLRNCVKSEPDKPYLKRAFNIDGLQLTHFKKTNKEGITKFLVDFTNKTDWGEDKGDFTKLVDKYSELINAYAESDYYLISKDWFSQDDEILNDPENWIYAYYFLIINVDRNSNLLAFSEWTYD